MGILSWLFGRNRQLERDLINLYAAMLDPMGISPRDARAWAKHAMKKARKESRAAGSDQLGGDFGDFLLAMSDTDQVASEILRKARQEGARDEDIRWWWNMYDLERRMMIEHDTLFKFTVYDHAREEGLTDAESTLKVKRSFPIYGDPDDTSRGKGDDRPIPYELKDRVNEWIQCQNRDALRAEGAKASSMNAFIRQEIQAGRL